MAGPLVVSASHVIIEGGLFALKDAFYSATLTGNVALDSTYPTILKLDPGGNNRDITLDAEATSEGLLRWIVNAADNTENLVVKDDGGSTIATLNQNEEGLFWCNGTAWLLIRIATIALS